MLNAWSAMGVLKDTKMAVSSSVIITRLEGYDPFSDSSPAKKPLIISTCYGTGL